MRSRELEVVPVGPVALTASNATLFTVRRQSRLTHIVVSNTTGLSKTLIIAVVPLGATIAAGYHIFSNLIISPNDFVSWDGLIPIMTGDTIQGSASDTGLVFRATVQEEY